MHSFVERRSSGILADNGDAALIMGWFTGKSGDGDFRENRHMTETLRGSRGQVGRVLNVNLLYFVSSDFARKQATLKAGENLANPGNNQRSSREENPAKKLARENWHDCGR